jgi:hypothetical protein
VADSITLRSTDGSDRLGLTGNPVKLSNGMWLNVGRRSVVDRCVDVWKAPAPQGPWRIIARVPIPAHSSGLASPMRVGGEWQPGIFHVSHYATIIPHLAGLAPEGFQVACCTTTNIGGAIDTDSTPIGFSAPMFVVVPES